MTIACTMSGCLCPGFDYEVGEHPGVCACTADTSTEFHKKKVIEMSDAVNHPQHYGGADNPYEAIKVIEAWGNVAALLREVSLFIIRTNAKKITCQRILRS